MLFQQTAGPDCNDDAGMAPGAVAMREALGWINVGFMIGTTLMILWQLGKNVSFRAKKMALMAAGFGPDAAGQGGSRMHAGHSAYDSKRRAETHFLLGARDGAASPPVTSSSFLRSSATTTTCTTSISTSSTSFFTRRRGRADLG